MDRYEQFEDRVNAAVEQAKEQIEAKAAKKLWVVISIALAVGAFVGFIAGRM